MSNSLYDEAIAEAKQLREVAEKNAKNAIIEAVTPRIRKFIEDQLVKGESSHSDDGFVSGALFESNQISAQDEEVVLDETALNSLMSLMKEADLEEQQLGNDEDVNRAMVAALGESFTSLDAAEQKKILEIAKNLTKETVNLSNSVIDIDTSINQENKKMSDDTLYEIDLDDLSRAFRSALNEAEHEDADEAYVRGVKQQMEEDAYMEDAYMEEGEHEDTDEGHYMEEAEHAEEGAHADLDELELDDMLKEIAFRLDLDIPDEAAEGVSADDLSITLIDDEEEVGDDSPGDADLADLELDAGDEEAPAEEVPLDEVFEIDPRMLQQEIMRMKEELTEGEAKAMAHHFGGGKAEKDALDFKDTDLNKLSENRHLRKALRSESRKNRALSGKIVEYRGAVETLREQLTEMNLFNAKLLYVNKLLQSHSMTPTKRRSIIEALDKASNLREVKLLYRSLTESLSANDGKKSLSESRLRNLGSSSRTVGRASASNSASAPGEVDRWSVLAGIK